MMMQWLVNDFKDLKSAVNKRIDDAIEAWTKKQIDDAERITKLEGEIKAMKARAGKKD